MPYPHLVQGEKRGGWLALIASTSLLILSACASPTAPDAVNESVATPSSPKQLCLKGLHRHSPSEIEVNRAVVAPLARIKTWVTTPKDTDIDWDEFSESLASAPLDERVGVCVLTKKDGASFTAPPEAGDPETVQSVVVIVRPNGEQTLYMLGSLESMLDSVPRSFAGPRFD